MSAACKIGDFEQLARLSIQAFDGGSNGEDDILDWISKVVEDNDLDEALCVIPRFVTQFQEARLGAQSCVEGDKQVEADLDLDAAAHEARLFLARLDRESGLQEGCKDPMTEAWVLQAIQLLGLAYCVAGARTYGQEVYACGASLATDEGWKLAFEQAIHQVERELTELDLREADYYWCRFLAENEYFKQISMACEETGLPHLQRRMAAIYRARAGGASVEPSSDLFLSELRWTHAASD